MNRLLTLLLLASAALAQDGGGELMTAGDALNVEMCEKIRDRVMPRIEAFTRMKYRRHVPIRVQPKAQWEALQKEEGFGGFSAKHALAFYRKGINDVTVVPWVIGGYPPPGQPGEPRKRTREEWIMELEPTLIHELTHAIHFQNFFSEGRTVQASLRSDGLSEDELDDATVEFLLSEGFPELVALRTTDFKGHMQRHPNPTLSSVRTYLKQYVPNKKDPYRVTLSEKGYSDGLDLLHHLQLKAGPGGVRACLYRMPPRILLFQPELLAAVDLEDPPDPDSILGFLYPEVLKGQEVRLAVNPGPGRLFEGAYQNDFRAPGCLIGYVAEVGAAGDPQGECRYAFFVADPDNAGDWSATQAASLKGLNPAGVTEKQEPLPFAGVKATVVSVKMEDGGLYVRGEAGGLVVLAHEAKPTPALEDRVVIALDALYQVRPKPRLYAEAALKALAALDKSSD
ncbi:MAG TPA: hypothetical protein VFY93_02805 [Planctomycetota bacterium]|nr:hypothetical protein [Planctomycetota bacterium]